MATLNNNQIVDVLRNAFAQSTGSKTYKNFYDIIGTGSAEEPQYPAGSDVPISSLDLQGIIDVGNDDSIIGSKEQFTKSLINVLVKRWYTDASYRSEINSPFFYSEEEYGAIVSMVSVECPDVRPNNAWKNLENGTVIGTYEVVLPTISETYFGAQTSYALPITISREQLSSAFNSEGELITFVNYIFLVIDNKLAQHHEDMDNMCRNNFIAEKLNAASDVGGVQKINLVERYCKENGIDAMTATEYQNTGLAIRHGMKTMNLFSGYMRKQSNLFNIARKTKHVPADRFVFQVLDSFKLSIDSFVLGDTFHQQYVDLKDRFQTLPYWQGFTADASDEELSFEAVSSINLKSASDGTVSTYSGIVGLMVDKFAIIHTLIKQRVAMQHFDIENVDLYEYQFHDRRMNNLELNGIVFTLEDYTAE